MLRALRNLLRLLTIVRTLARYGALGPLRAAVEGAGVAPTMLVAGRLLTTRRARRWPGDKRPGERIAAAFGELGPAFIKLGQMLSTRSDLLGDAVAADLSTLQDRLPPFDPAVARATIEAELGAPIDELFTGFDDRPVSAASIAQVHYATIAREDGETDEVAVKVLRPGIEQAFARDLDLLMWLAELVERTQPKLRRLRPVEVVRTFAETVRIEMDLRLEAAAAAELAQNFAGDPTYRVPAVDWRRTARRVMTQQRLTGIPMDDRAALVAAGFDIEAVLTQAAAIFFKQVFRDGYFHGDQHPGNMFVGPNGNIGAVDFGIMGRLDRKTRYYLADMLLGFLERDYRRVAQVHFDAGYVPPTQSLDHFAQAIRSIGEPIFGRPLNEISFARMLGHLFRIAEAFEMEAQPQLLLLQKNMLMAEGVSRQLDPSLNIWTLAQPLIERWMRENRGPEARIREAVEDALRAASRLPDLLVAAERAATAVADTGVKPHPTALRARDREIRWAVLPLWVAVGLLAVLILLAL
jgi:ubiquinone biosynthesis protein